MLSGIWKFFKRHQRKFIVGSAIFSGIILATRYTQYKIREWQQKEIRAILERAKKQQHFEHLEKTCDQITTSLALNVRNTIIKELDGQTIINQLKHGSADKIALWNELKVVSISRSAVVIYAYTMLITFLKIQINLISGYMYLNQTVDNTDGYDVRAKYLQLSAYFIYEGVQKLCNLIKSKVEQITASISLDDKLTLRDLEQIYWAITSSIFADSSNDPIKNFVSYTMSQQVKKDTSIYSKIIDQTLDLLESDEVQNLTQRNIRSGFVSLIDHISEYFDDASETKNGISHPRTSNKNDHISMNSKDAVTKDNGTSEFLDINKTTMPMAKIIPIVIGQIPDKQIAKDASADLLECLMTNNEIKMLGANIYEAFSCKTYT
ncbi:peroxisomal biogenesis factor 3 [Harpegnathos saltator]|uniref:Peroxisomal biogenesis factor 3 n=1 Tax=Harpegnathos saltator TaxID=610380 RepID=E2B8P2_HARSA|nr:peroxisomal biogenesis factor 3 [Harpegnathos saltator]EFN87948.1 Peroxisomal biogenesis factor 3 [Harpegnathos saltator]